MNTNTAWFNTTGHRGCVRQRASTFRRYAGESRNQSGDRSQSSNSNAPAITAIATSSTFENTLRLRAELRENAHNAVIFPISCPTTAAAFWLCIRLQFSGKAGEMVMSFG